jgi:uncharacterized membrane protein
MRHRRGVPARGHRLASQTGAAAVETALVLPFLLMLFTGIGDVGWMAWQRIQLQEAVQEGAVYAAFNPTDPGETVTRVVHTSNYAIDAGDVAVTCSAGDRVVEVTVVREHRLLTGLLFDYTPTFEVGVIADVMRDADCVPS